VNRTTARGTKVCRSAFDFRFGLAGDPASRALLRIRVRPEIDNECVSGFAFDNRSGALPSPLLYRLVDGRNDLASASSVE